MRDVHQMTVCLKDVWDDEVACLTVPKFATRYLMIPPSNLAPEPTATPIP